MRKSPLASLKKTADFMKVYSLGSRVFCKYFIVYVHPNDKNYPRLGLSISKKVGKAVVRNKLRRCLREYFRLHSFPNIDIVVVGRVPAKELVFSKTYNEVEKILNSIASFNP